MELFSISGFARAGPLALFPVSTERVITCDSLDNVQRLSCGNMKIISMFKVFYSSLLSLKYEPSCEVISILSHFQLETASLVVNRSLILCL